MVCWMEAMNVAGWPGLQDSGEFVRGMCVIVASAV
jgi:hypothetical protein